MEITKPMIKEGLKDGCVKIIDSPHSDGAVCAIDYSYADIPAWFYFGGHEAESMTAAEYLKNVPEEDIVNEIFGVLDEDMKSDPVFKDEYDYYSLVLRDMLMRKAEEKPDRFCSSCGKPIKFGLNGFQMSGKCIACRGGFPKYPAPSPATPCISYEQLDYMEGRCLGDADE